MLGTEGSHMRHKFIKMAVIDTWEQVMFNLHVETSSEEEERVAVSGNILGR